VAWAFISGDVLLNWSCYYERGDERMKSHVATRTQLINEMDY